MTATVTTAKTARQLLRSTQALAQCARMASTATERACDVFEKTFQEDTKPYSSHQADDVILQYRPPRVRFSHLPRGHVNFKLQDYLGLSTHPEIITEHQRALADLGTTGVVGNDDGAWSRQLELEQRLAAFHGRRAALTCVVPHAGLTNLFNSVLTEKDIVFYDKWTHPYLLQCLKQWNVRKVPYSHKNLPELESQLKSCIGRFKIVLTEGVFSRDCTIAPLRDIADVVDSSDGLLLVDDSHGVGLLGENLRGTEEHCGALKRFFLLTSAMNTALGQSIGSYTVGPPSVIDCLQRIQRKNPHGLIIPPAVAVTTIKALDMLPYMRNTVKNLQMAHINLANRLRHAGFKVVDTIHPVVQIRVGDEHAAGMLLDQAFECGILANMKAYPDAPKGDARVEVTCTAHHTLGDIDFAHDVLVESGQRLGIISNNQENPTIKHDKQTDMSDLHNANPNSITNWKH